MRIGSPNLPITSGFNENMGTIGVVGPRRIELFAAPGYGNYMARRIESRLVKNRSTTSLTVTSTDTTGIVNGPEKKEADGRAFRLSFWIQKPTMYFKGSR